MNSYDDIKKAVANFNEIGMRSDDLQKQLQAMADAKFWQGFEACLDVCYSVLGNLDDKSLYPPGAIFDLIDDEIQAYKSDS